MKYLLIFIFLFNLDAFARRSKRRSSSPFKKYHKLTSFLVKNENYFSAITPLKNALKARGNRKSSGFEALAYKVLLEVSVIPFLSLPDEAIKAGGRSFSSFILGKKYFERKNFNLAIKYLKRVKRGEFYYPHALFHLAGMYQLNNNYKRAFTYFKESALYASKVKKQYNTDDYRYIALDFIQDSSTVSMGRVFYKKGDLINAAKVYKNISMSSYVYPESLFESSWNFFRVKHYEQSLGKLLTFQAPFMQDYFFAESEIIKGLVFIKLCRWHDLLNLVKHYRANLKTPARNFVKFLNKSNEKEKYVRLMIDEKFQKSIKDNFMLRMINVIRTKPTYVSLKRVFGKFNKEFKSLKRSKRKYGKSLYKLIAAGMAESMVIYRDFITNYIKRRFVSLGQDVIRLDASMTEMELFVISKVKSDIYKRQSTLTDSDKIINLTELEQNKDQFYYDFRGEFWADEIGSYLPVLKSQCNLKR